MQRLTFEGLTGKTVKQTQALLRSRIAAVIRGRFTAGQLQSDLALLATRLVSTEWNAAVEAAGGSPDDWPYARFDPRGIPVSDPADSLTPATDDRVTTANRKLTQQQKEFVSERTKAGLEAARRRGVKIGGMRQGAGEKCREQAENHAKPLLQIISAARGHQSLQAIADKLNAAGHKTQQGKAFSKMAVKRIIDRYLNP